MMSESREAERQHATSALSSSPSVSWLYNKDPLMNDTYCHTLTHIQYVEMIFLAALLHQFCLHRSLGKENKKQNVRRLM